MAGDSHRSIFLISLVILCVLTDCNCLDFDKYSKMSKCKTFETSKSENTYFFKIPKVPGYDYSSSSSSIKQVLHFFVFSPGHTYVTLGTENDKSLGYNFNIGYELNQKTDIMKNTPGWVTLVNSNTPQLLSRDDPKEFVIELYKNGLIKLVVEGKTVAEAKDNSNQFDVSYAAFSSHKNISNYILYDCFASASNLDNTPSSTSSSPGTTSSGTTSSDTTSSGTPSSSKDSPKTITLNNPIFDKLVIYTYSGTQPKSGTTKAWYME